jgi:hypothetical protein
MSRFNKFVAAALMLTAMFVTNVAEAVWDFG